MLRSLGDALASSVGKKIVMGTTGLLLVVFLIGHLSGNLPLLPAVDPTGEAFDEYVEFLNGFGPLKLAAEFGLIALFGVHIFLAIRLTLENREARKQRYVVRNNRGASTMASTSMFVTGSLLLAFMIKHLIDFRFNEAFHEDPAATVGATLASPISGLIYTAAAVVAGVHVSHGFRSLFQSVGVSHPSWNPILSVTGKAISALVAVGFGGIALYFLLVR